MNFLYRCGWTFFRVSMWTWLRWRHFNAERVPNSGSVILASNHASILDPPVVGSALSRQINYLARATLFEIPVVGWLFRNWNAIPIDRDGGNAAGLKIILSRLEQGNGIILFPEGTRTRDGKLQPARSGIGLIVAKSTAPVVPVRTFGTFEAMGRNARFPRPKKVSVKFGQPMMFEKLRAEAKTCDKARLKEIYQQIADEIMMEIAKLEPKRD
ncbi:MAG TPA: lysophospholipid acyltransferase family protein [Verrucomicrobiae bacterium]|nr:lysophospholipid acyltransferase family protein [Verrucomicrobiae bacterium]